MLISNQYQVLPQQVFLLFQILIISMNLLFYGDQVISLESPDLQIPHPRILERALVLVPLLEIAPSLIHPTVGIEIQNLPTPYISETAIRKWGIPIDLENFLSRQ